MKKITALTLFVCALASGIASAQRINVGITFQYLILKQVSVKSDIIQGSNSYSTYTVKDNRWKFFSAGQSIIIGTVFQLDFKKFYAVIEPSFDLNTYNYSVYYPVAPGVDERLIFQTLFLQVDCPLYFGYQFGATNLIRYSLFAGAVAVTPYAINVDLQSKDFKNPQYDYFSARDMEGILYTEKPYVNSLVGFCLHFANVGKLDLRYQHRLKSPGIAYPTTFNSVGVAMTFYLPLNFKKKTIFYED
jgi:hypothetical protein